MIDLPLNPVPRDGWQAEFDALMAHQYLRKKYSRKKRLREKAEYIDRHCPQVKQGGGFVLDVGPGPGEFLELCRHYGNGVQGIDATSGSGGMGDGYVALSRMMHERQEIKCLYCGFLPFIDQADLHPGCSASLINFQGSWAQCFSAYLDGPPHETNHLASEQHWRLGPDLRKAWLAALQWIKSVLSPDGRLLILDNRVGTLAEQREAADGLRLHAMAAGLSEVNTDGEVYFHWRRQR